MSDSTPSQSEIEALSAEVSLRCQQLLAAGKQHLEEASAASLERVVDAAREHTAAHRRWFALAHPELDYDLVYAGSPQ